MRVKQPASFPQKRRVGIN